jgi:hypothetical protein
LQKNFNEKNVIIQGVVRGVPLSAVEFPLKQTNYSSDCRNVALILQKASAPLLFWKFLIFSVAVSSS